MKYLRILGESLKERPMKQSQASFLELLLQVIQHRKYQYTGLLMYVLFIFMHA